MARCDACGQTMKGSTTCSLEKLVIAGRERKRMRLGTETLWRSAAPVTRCRDCGVQAGGLHHPGCDYEQCPVCGAQLFCCDCSKGEIGRPKKTRKR